MRCSLLSTNTGNFKFVVSYSKMVHVHSDKPIHSDWLVYNDTDINVKNG